MNKEQILAIIQGGHTTDGDLADALLAELAKVQEPVAKIDYKAPYGITFTLEGSMIKDGTKLYTQPLPQPDLVAEIEQTKAARDFAIRKLKSNAEQYQRDAIEYERQIVELRQQLSEAQASEDALLKAH